MSLLTFKNFAKGELATTLTDSATVVDLQPGHGSRFPNAPFVACISNATDYSDPADAFWAGQAELVLVTTNPTSSQFPVVQRGYDGTTPVAFSDSEKKYIVFGVANEGFLTGVPQLDKDDDEYVFATNGIDRMRIDSNGSVGIGNPIPTLSVNDALRVRGDVFFNTLIHTQGLLLPVVATETIIPTHNYHRVDVSGGAETVSTINAPPGVGGGIFHLVLAPNVNGTNLVFNDTGNIDFHTTQTAFTANHTTDTMWLTWFGETSTWLVWANVNTNL